MHVSLTDVLTCPHCGPGNALILLPDEVADRRVVTGVLGCASCRRQYPINAAVADFAAGAGDGAAADEPDAAAVDVAAGAQRLGGLLGLGAGSGVVLLAAPSAGLGPALASMLESVEVVTMSVVEPAAPGDDPAGSESDPSSPARGGAAGVSQVRVAGGLPFQDGSLRGVALGDATAGLLEEAARVLGPGGRLLLEPAPADARSRVEAAGLRVLGEQDGALLAAR